MDPIVQSYQCHTTGLTISCQFSLSGDAIKHLLSVNRDSDRCLYANCHLGSFDPAHRDEDLIADHYFFPDISNEYQHILPRCLFGSPAPHIILHWHKIRT